MNNTVQQKFTTLEIKRVSLHMIWVMMLVEASAVMITANYMPLNNESVIVHKSLWLGASVGYFAGLILLYVMQLVLASRMLTLHEIRINTIDNKFLLALWSGLFLFLNFLIQNSLITVFEANHAHAWLRGALGVFIPFCLLIGMYNQLAKRFLSKWVCIVLCNNNTRITIRRVPVFLTAIVCSIFEAVTLTIIEYYPYIPLNRTAAGFICGGVGAAMGLLVMLLFYRLLTTTLGMKPLIHLSITPNDDKPA